MGLIEKARKKIEALESREVRERYLDALEMSIDGDYGNPRSIQSPTMIEDQCGLELDVQLKFLISLDKRRAVELLDEKGKEVSLAVIRKKFSQAAYKKKFKREISKIGTMHLFTYSEILVLANHLVPLK